MEVDPIRWYKSKVDWWLAILLALPPIASMIVTILAIQRGNPMEMILGIGSMLFLAGIYFGLVFPMRYGIGSSHLIIRYGIFRQHVQFNDIVEVRPTRNPLSSPALSLDRLHIQFGSGIFKAVMISPTQREQFLADIAKSAGLDQVGNRLVRRQAKATEL